VYSPKRTRVIPDGATLFAAVIWLTVAEVNGVKNVINTTPVGELPAEPALRLSNVSTALVDETADRIELVSTLLESLASGSVPVDKSAAFPLVATVAKPVTCETATVTGSEPLAPCVDAWPATFPVSSHA
jgi:hypothetical protein